MTHANTLAIFAFSILVSLLLYIDERTIGMSRIRGRRLAFAVYRGLQVSLAHCAAYASCLSIVSSGDATPASAASESVQPERHRDPLPDEPERGVPSLEAPTDPP